MARKLWIGTNMANPVVKIVGKIAKEVMKKNSKQTLTPKLGKKAVEKTAKATKKENGVGEYKLPKTKTAGSTSPMTKVNNPSPVKGQ
jgi:hypothetical protein